MECKFHKKATDFLVRLFENFVRFGERNGEARG